MHIYIINGAVPVILSCTDDMFLVFELSTRFLAMILQNILILYLFCTNRACKSRTCVLFDKWNALDSKTEPKLG